VGWLIWDILYADAKKPLTEFKVSDPEPNPYWILFHEVTGSGSGFWIGIWIQEYNKAFILAKKIIENLNEVIFFNFFHDSRKMFLVQQLIDVKNEKNA